MPLILSHPKYVGLFFSRKKFLKSKIDPPNNSLAPSSKVCKFLAIASASISFADSYIKYYSCIPLSKLAAPLNNFNSENYSFFCIIRTSRLIMVSSKSLITK